MCSILFTNKELKGDYNRLLKLRGPDGTNIETISGYNFVHNLLSLTGEKTIQPITSDGIIVLLNGEIYNYDKKHKSDGYSIIDFYKKYGDTFTKEIDGEFTIVLVDTNKQKIIFSTDTFKTKPIFYSIEDGNIGISTFYTSLKELGFSNTIRTKPNTTYVIDLNTGDFSNFQITSFDLKQHKTSYDDWLETFDRAIKKRALHSGDKKLFIGLSSGYDSGAIACSLSKLEVDTKSYSIYASENRNTIDERCRVLGNVHTIDFTHNDYAHWSKFIHENVESFKSDDFVGYDIKNDKASVGLAYICSLAIQEDRKVYLSGQGSDEIFADYGMFGNEIMRGESSFAGNFPTNLEDIYPWPNFYNSKMEMYIAKEEYIAGTFGIETRYPFLDKEVVQEFLWLDHNLKNKYYKSVVHEYLTINNFPFDLNSKIGFQANRGLV
tara:strand:- start:821 stop:2128 length:1308 start_codon:yes stop_codon:yes gene_type:complete